MISPTQRLGSSLLLALTVFLSPGLDSKAARADLLGLTGNVERDFSLANPSVQVIRDRIDDVAQPAWMSDRGWTTGFNIKDLRFNYDSATDKLQVGVNFVGIAGDADGNGDPGLADPRLTGSRGSDVAHLGGMKSIVVAFAGLKEDGSMGAPLLIAGTPQNKSLASTSGLSGFTVASYLDRGRGLSNNFGSTVAGLTGSLAFDPSAEHPDYVFTIDDFARLGGLRPQSGMYVRAFAGDPGASVIGEDAIYWSKLGPFSEQREQPTSVPPPQVPPAVVPEPISLIHGLLGGVGVLWIVRRTRARHQAGWGLSVEP